MTGGSGQGFILTRLLDYADSANIVTIDTTPTIIRNITRQNNEFVAYPNPTHNQVTIQYNIANSDNVTIKLWDVLGRALGTILDNAARLPGIQTENISMASLPSGCLRNNGITLFLLKIA